MMLADRLIQDTRNPKGVHVFLREFADAVAQAVHFEISDDVGRIAHAVSKSDAKKLLAAQQFCRVPFQSVWIEWVGPSAKFGLDRTQPTPEDQRESRREMPKPDRCGVLVESLADDMAMAMVSFAWVHNNLGANCAPLSFLFDWSGNRRIPKRKRLMEMPNSEVRDMFPRFKNASDDELNELESRGEVIENPRMVEFLDAVQKAGPIAMAQVRDNAMADVQGEIGFAEALLSVMNSRNLVAVSDPVDMSKINKARRRMGRGPLLSFRSVRLSLSRQVERRRNETIGGAMPLHTVRGHFKVRKSGIYWWSPFWRGDASVGVVERTGYKVVR